MTELDVELSRTVAEAVTRRHGRWLARATHGTSVAALTLLLAAVAVLLVR